VLSAGSRYPAGIRQFLCRSSPPQRWLRAQSIAVNRSCASIIDPHGYREVITFDVRQQARQGRVADIMSQQRRIGIIGALHA